MATYNGYKNWTHWNVSLWIKNDEGLYMLASDMVRHHKTRDEAARAIVKELLQMGIAKTPDGARYSIAAVRAAISGLEEGEIMAKMKFHEVMEKINDGIRVNPADVAAAALRRRVWCVGIGQPGCLFDTFSVHTTKREAFEAAMIMADDGENGPPRGMVTALKRSGIFYGPRFIVELYPAKVADLI